MTQLKWITILSSTSSLLQLRDTWILALLMSLMVRVSIHKIRIGSFVNFNEHTTHDDIIKVLQASVSFPGVFSPIEAFGSMWFSKSD